MPSLNITQKQRLRKRVHMLNSLCLEEITRLATEVGHWRTELGHDEEVIHASLMVDAEEFANKMSAARAAFDKEVTA